MGNENRGVRTLLVSHFSFLVYPLSSLSSMTLETLTLLSTTFIVLSGASLLLGWYFIRWRKNRKYHEYTMLSATAFAALFLVFYVTRWAMYGSKPFEGEGIWQTIYYVILIPHVILAIAVGPLALYLIWLARLKKDFRTHRRFARWTLPIWLFVAASGWVIYYMLYRMF
jgi:putative membrane protein